MGNCALACFRWKSVVVKAFPFLARRFFKNRRFLAKNTDFLRKMPVPNDLARVPNEKGHVPNDLVRVPNEKGRVPNDFCTVPNEKGHVPNDFACVPNEKGHAI